MLGRFYLNSNMMLFFSQLTLYLAELLYFGCSFQIKSKQWEHEGTKKQHLQKPVREYQGNQMLTFLLRRLWFTWNRSVWFSSLVQVRTEDVSTNSAKSMRNNNLCNLKQILFYVILNINTSSMDLTLSFLHVSHRLTDVIQIMTIDRIMQCCLI